MAKHKVAELEGALLDAAVARAENKTLERDEHGNLYAKKHFYSDKATGWSPSRWWEQGGPIIEREAIALYPPLCVGDYGEWEATVCGKDQGEKGATPLIAAMRAYVASKLGEEVELP